MSLCIVVIVNVVDEWNGEEGNTGYRFGQDARTLWLQK
jgi:hypothetical protein